MKNRMRESRSFGSVRGEGGNVLAYSETALSLLGRSNLAIRFARLNGEFS